MSSEAEINEFYRGVTQYKGFKAVRKQFDNYVRTIPDYFRTNELTNSELKALIIRKTIHIFKEAIRKCLDEGPEEEAPYAYEKWMRHSVFDKLNYPSWDNFYRFLFPLVKKYAELFPYIIEYYKDIWINRHNDDNPSAHAVARNMENNPSLPFREAPVGFSTASDPVAIGGLRRPTRKYKRSNRKSSRRFKRSGLHSD
jgi:hypothetical protein